MKSFGCRGVSVVCGGIRKRGEYIQERGEQRGSLRQREAGEEAGLNWRGQTFAVPSPFAHEHTHLRLA